MTRRAILLGGCLVAASSLAACGGTAQTATPVTSATSPATATRQATATPQATATGSSARADQATSSAPASSATTARATDGCLSMARAMGQDEQVGQLFMVGTQDTRATSALHDLVQSTHVGSVLYLGSSSRSLASTSVMSRTIAQWNPRLPVLLAADQEGGKVQRLAGAGFSRIPSATRQGMLSAAALQSSWAGWGDQLRQAGVYYDLAPVSDVVPPGFDASNDPVGALDRNYGTNRSTVADSITAVVKGLRQADVASALKHYPGLGRTAANTDFGVAHDTSTEPSDIDDYTAGMRAGVSSVMVSSSIYRHLDPNAPAVFSHHIITDLLRGRQGWSGAVISDDLGSAVAVQQVAPGQRGVRFLEAGGDLVIDAAPSLLPQMVQGVIERASQDAGFAASLPEHVARVLALKASVGLVTCHA